MLRFQVFDDGKPAQSAALGGAYLLGGDGVPIRAELEFRNGEILCRKKALVPAALAVLTPLNSGGRILLETTRLPERERPYVLAVELLRGRLMRIAQKREDWGLFDLEGLDEINQQVDAARDLLVASLQADTPAESATLAQRGLDIGLLASEQMATLHAEIFLGRRKQMGSIPRRLLGCTVDPTCTDAAYRERVAASCDFVSLPFPWRLIEPQDKEFNYAPFDEWVEWLTKNRIPIRGSALVSFDKSHLPDWLHIWKHDYDTVRDLLYEHLRRVLTRYAPKVQSWDVVTGLHACNLFGFRFEQLMELTRMSAAIAKQIAPRSVTVLDIVAPWGEYFASNQQSTIPPMLYADTVLQSGVNFDAFGVQFHFGVGSDGLFVRDLFQVSCMLDRFAGLGKPLHVTGVAVPSAITADPRDGWEGTRPVAGGGAWHRDWSEDIQRAWLRRVYHLALSKPFVEAVTWRDLGDGRPHLVPHGGLLRPDHSPKPAYHEVLAIREELTVGRRPTAAHFR